MLNHLCGFSIFFGRILLCALLAGFGAFTGAFLGDSTYIRNLAKLVPDISPKLIEVTFVLDLSAGMNEELQGLAGGIDDFAYELRQIGYETRMGLVWFRRNPAQGEPQAISFGGQPLTSEAAAFRAELSTLKVGDPGGEDSARVLDSLLYAARQTTDPKSVRVIVLITDLGSSPKSTIGPASDAAAELLRQKVALLEMMVSDPDLPPFTTLRRTVAGQSITLPKRVVDRRNFAFVVPQLGVRIGLDLAAIPSLSRQAAEFVRTGSASGLTAAGAMIGILLSQVLLRSRPFTFGKFVRLIAVGFCTGIVACLLGIGAAAVRPASLTDWPANSIVTMTSSWVLGMLLALESSISDRSPSRIVMVLMGGLAGIIGPGLAAGISPPLVNVPTNWIECALFGFALGTAVSCASSMASRTRKSSGNGYELWLSSNRTIPLRVGVTLNSADLPGVVSSSPGTVLAQVIRNPLEPDVLGLQNQTNRAWSVVNPQGQQKQVDPGRSVKLISGTRIDFGSIQGRIQGV